MRSVRHFVLITLVSASFAGGCDDPKPVTANDAGATGGSTGAGGSTATGGSTGAGGATATGGSTGTGGSTATGGAGGTTATGGSTGSDAGTPPASTCMIPCIVALTQDCVPSGTCTEQTNGIAGSNRCYSNGVKVATTAVVIPPSISLTSKKPGGGVCYTVVGTLANLQSTTATLVLKDAAGQQVGTGTYDLTTNKAQVMCDGASFDAVAVASCASVLSLPSLPSAGTAAPNDCTPGVCAP